MSKRSHSKKSHSKESVLHQDTIRLPFKNRIISNGSAIPSIPLNPPNLSTRVNTEADGFAEFRIVKFRFRLSPQDVPGTTVVGVGYVVGVSDTPPTSVVQISNLAFSAIMPVRQTVPSNWVTVSVGELAGYQTWYKTIPGTPEAAEEIPGTLYVGPITATDTYILEFEGVMELRGSIFTGNTPVIDNDPGVIEAKRKARSQLLDKERFKERSQVLMLLGGTDKPSTSLYSSSLKK